MSKQQGTIVAPLSLFISYAHEDESLLQRLETHLSPLRRQGIIDDWHDRQILAGNDWAQDIDQHLESASIILLLISPDFLASDSCYDVILQKALARQQAGKAIVIPILLRPVDREASPFAHLQSLPHNGKPIKSWDDTDEAFVTIARELRAVIKQWSSSSANTGAVSRLPDAFARRSSAPKDVNRRRILERVHKTWITGVLEHSLHGAMLIELSLENLPAALENPWRLTVQETNLPPRPLPAGTSIVQVYDEADESLLILGEPGAGKTTLLLELGRILISRAQTDEQEPIPVVFNLSSWAVQHAALEDWLIEELHDRYEVPRPVGANWVKQDQLLLLLDGLDEVAPVARSACIEAINRYRSDHPLVPLAVCSRRAGYLDQVTRLRAQTAVMVQPLTSEQVESYLESVGKEAKALRTALHQDADLRELATTPLILTILLLAYKGTSADKISELTSRSAKREQIFASYVQHMLKRRRAQTRYTPEQTTHWLSHLAGQMRRQSQSIFYLEQMQPDWLIENRMLGVYDWLAVRLPGVLIGILVSFAVSLLLAGHGFWGGTPLSLLGGLLGGLLSRESAAPRPTLVGEQNRKTFWLRCGQRLLLGVLIGLGFVLSFDPGYDQNFDLSVGLSFGLCGILLQVLLGRTQTAVTPSHTSSPMQEGRWQHLIRRRAIRNGILVGLLIGLSLGLSVALLSRRLSSGLVNGLDAGLSSGLAGGFLSLLLIGRSARVQLTDRLTWSWKSLGRSLLSKRHVIATLQIMALIGLSVWLSRVLIEVLSEMESAALSYGLSIGLINGLINGLSIGLSYGLLIGLIQGVSSQTIEDQHRVLPNQGIRRSAINGIVFGLISALLSGLSFWLSSQLSDGQSFGLSAGLYGGLSLGLLVGLLVGGLACLRHYVLRFLLWHSGSVPWHYVSFLDYAAERILLRKVGGGYIFIHRLLLDYFAALETSSPKEASVGEELF